MDCAPNELAKFFDPLLQQRIHDRAQRGKRAFSMTIHDTTDIVEICLGYYVRCQVNKGASGTLSHHLLFTHLSSAVVFAAEYRCALAHSKTNASMAPRCSGGTRNS